MFWHELKNPIFIPIKHSKLMLNPLCSNPGPPTFASCSWHMLSIWIQRSHGWSVDWLPSGRLWRHQLEDISVTSLKQIKLSLHWLLTSGNLNSNLTNICLIFFSPFFSLGTSFHLRLSIYISFLSTFVHFCTLTWPDRKLLIPKVQIIFCKSI